MRDINDILKNTKPVPFDTDKLVPYENNVKKHPPEQVDGIATSISRFGWNGSPILIDENNVVINGHGRRLAAIKLGMKKVPVVVLKGLTEEEKKSLRLADNKVSISEYDTDALQRELESISVTADVNELLGGVFSEKELDFLDADLGMMDESVFRDDIGEVSSEMKSHIDQKIRDFDESDVQVPVSKVMGFNMVGEKYAVYIERFIDAVATESEKPSDVAFGEFCKNYVGE